VGILKDKDLKAILSGDVVPDKKKLVDGEGLYIHLKSLAAGGFGMYWKYDYQFAGKRLTLSIGTYPLINTSEARKTHREAKVGLTKGIDPMMLKRAGKTAQASATNFKTVAFAWLENKEGAERGKQTIANYYKNDIFPVMGNKSITEVTTADVVSTVQRVSKRGSQDQARRVGRWLYKIFRYAKPIWMLENNPADFDLKDILKPHRSKPHAAITDPVLFGQFLRDVDHYHGYYATTCLLKLAALVMLRPGELVAAEWSEIDFETSTWIIEAKRMKNRQKVKEDNWEEDQHIVPLSRQAVGILQELQQYNSQSKYVFPGLKGNSGHMCRDTIRVAIRNMGYDNESMTGHGFRASARTMLEDQLGYDPKTAERQLAHKGKDPHKGAYDRTKHLDKRREMLQAWADYLDNLRNGAQGECK
jgi:integrase